jgi:DNA helicase-2/ATP-dependent DNA helicase PcrA
MYALPDDLNPEQRQAVLHDGGHLLIVAGAGSGKTMTLACRVARLLSDGVPPERILLLTFSRRAASEMLSRAGRMAAAGGASRVWGGTFHAVAHRLLHRYGRSVGLRPGFTVLDQGDSVDLLGLVRHQLGAALQERRFPKKETLASLYSRLVNAQERLTDVVERDFPWCRDDIVGIREVFSGYAERKRAQNVVDYDDLLLYWRALATTAAASAPLSSAFDHLLVDEYQDTNAVQADIVAAMAGPGVCVTAVGDDAQAIYGFRSGSARHMIEFPTRFTGTTLVTLDRNYRSTPAILAAANAVMTAARFGFPKELRATRPAGGRPVLAACSDEQAQAVYVCEQVLEQRERGIPLHRQAVLFRSGQHSATLELELARRNIPYVKYGGLKFLEAGHVKDLLCLLRILENPGDELAWHRFLSLLPGVGPRTTERLVRELGVAEAIALQRLLGDDCPLFPEESAVELHGLRAALRECSSAGLPPAAEVERLSDACAAVFARRYPGNDTVRLADLDHLRSMASGYRIRARFLAEITLDPPSKTGDLAGPPHLDDDQLILSTIHSAKGGEWQAVYIIHASDGNIPSDMALSSVEGLEEERRLLYVALTRARDVLAVSYPIRYYTARDPRGDRHVYGQPSRFLQPALTHLDRVDVGERSLAMDPVSAHLEALLG